MSIFTDISNLFRSFIAIRFQLQHRNSFFTRKCQVHRTPREAKAVYPIKGIEVIAIGCESLSKCKSSGKSIWRSE